MSSVSLAFTVSNNLTSHMIVHGNRRQYYCPYCGKLFKAASHLKRHSYVHTGAKPYSCTHCSECFRWQVTLKSHLLMTHNEGTWFTCHICREKFSYKTNLKEHMKVWSRMRWMSKVFLYSECSSDLKHHQVVHSDVKKFCCGFCGKDFKRPRERVVSVLFFSLFPPVVPSLPLYLVIWEVLGQSLFPLLLYPLLSSFQSPVAKSTSLLWRWLHGARGGGTCLPTSTNCWAEGHRE